MMRRTLPLTVNIRVAAFATIGFREIASGNVYAARGLGGAWEERAARAVTFVVHRFRSDRRIIYAVRTLPWHSADPPGTRGQESGGGQEGRSPNCSGEIAGSGNPTF